MRPLFSARDEVKALADTAVQAKTAAITSPSVRGRPYRTAWDIERAVRDGMKRITWVFRCVHVRAAKSAGLPIVVRRGNPETGDTIENHELLPLLNAYPTSPEERESSYAFRYRVSCIADLNPQGAFIEVQRARIGGAAVALRILPPGYTSPIPGADGQRFLQGFRVHVPGTNPVDLAPESVVWVKHPHPTDPYDGLNPMQAAGIAIDTEWLAKVYQRNFLKNDGRGAGLLVVAGDMEGDDLDELQRQVDMSGGPAGAGRITVIEGTARDAGTGEPTGEVGGVHYVDTAITPRDASYIEMRKVTKEEIHGAWGVPTSIGGADSSNRTFDNADADYYMFWNDTMVDHCRMVYRPFDVIDSDPTTFVGADFSSVEVLQRAKQAREKFNLEELKAGGIVADEYRDATNRPPFAKGGDVVRVPLSLTPVASITESTAVDEFDPNAPVGSSSTTPPAPAAAALSPTGAPESKSSEPDLVRFGRFEVPAVALKARRRERSKRLQRWEATAQRRLKSYFASQERAVLEKLQGAKTRQGTRHWRQEGGGNGEAPAATKVITADDIFDRGKWDARLREEGEALVADVTVDFGQETFDHVTDAAKGVRDVEEKADDVFDDSTPRLLDFILARGNKIVGCNDTTYDDIAHQLAEGEAAGETIVELAVRVAAVFDEAKGSRAETIARTEVISAANMGTMEGARQSGVVETKVWLATSDDRTRDTHAELDGQAVAVDDVFESSSGETLDFPGDPDADPSETVNCRCTVTFETDDGSLL